MATVYLAEDLKHHRKVAIKVLREDLAASLGSTRFLREIEIAAQLQHPHILPLLDSGEANGFLFYVMPYISGQSLRERLTREGELPVHEAVRLIIEVVDALAHAHEHGVVHRDIKPDNVMLSGRHALVTDFGVAKAVSDATGRNQVTTVGVTLGTPTYMSPEQAAADPHIDHRSDIYAVGVMAYELLSGRPPFVGATPQQVLAAHVTEAPDPVTRRRPGISPALDAIIMRCLAKRPADRFQTAHELLSQLEPLATASTGSTPPATRPVAAAGVRRRVSWLPVVAVVAVIVVIGAAGYWHFGAGHGASPVTHAIAVLPFENATRDTASDYLADGMANDVRSGLMKLPQLTVKARTSSGAARGKSIHDAGALLHADVILQGTFRRTGDKITVTVDLVNVANEAALWSGRYVLPADGNFASAQDSITAGLSSALHLQSVTGGANAQARRGTNDPEAYNLYLKGQFFFSQRGSENLFSAIAYFRAAVARDPGFARGYAGWAMALSVLPNYSQAAGDTAQAVADRMARRALAIDSSLAEGHLALANALGGELRPQEAEVEFAAALARDPASAIGHEWCGDNYAVLGRLDDGLREGRLAVNLDPLSAVAAADYSYALFVAGQFVESRRLARRALMLDPGYSAAYQYLGSAFAFERQPDSAEAMYDHFFHTDADSLGPQARAFYVWRFALDGQWPEAERQLATMQRVMTGGSRDVDLAIANIALGHKTAALDALERMVHARSFFAASFTLGCDPVFSILKSEPRFIALVKDAGQRICPGLINWPIPARPGAGKS